MDSWILSLHWVPKGGLLQQPLEYEMTPKAMDDLTMSMNNLTTTDAEGKKHPNKHNDYADDGLGGESEGEDIDDDAENEEDIMKALGMDEYSDDDDGDEQTVLDKFIQQAAGCNVEDEYIDDGLGDDDEDNEENQINPNDSILLIGQTVPGQDECFIEVHCYNNDTNALYIHHDIQVPAPPIALQYLSVSPILDTESQQPTNGAFVAVGMMSPGIEVWNLNVMHPIEPTAVLGGYDFANMNDTSTSTTTTTSTTTKKTTPKKQIQPKLKDGSHSDNVTSLSWHPQYPSRLLSGSSDKTIKMWNVPAQQCVTTWNHHKSTIAIVQWNPLQPNVFLAGSEDGMVSIVDINTNTIIFQYILQQPQLIQQSITIAPSTTKTATGKKILKKPIAPKKPKPITLETARWNNVNPNIFYVTLSNGTLHCLDIRTNPISIPITQQPSQQSIKPSQPTWSLQLSQDNKPIPSLSPSTLSETLFVTVGEDGYVKVWDLPVNHPHTTPQPNDAIIQPSLLTSRQVNVGKLFSCSFDINNPLVLATGGDGGCPAIWDLMENIHVNKRYKAIVEQSGFGDQTLPKEYIQQQLAGIESKGIGPGRQYRDGEQDDYDSDDESDNDGKGFDGLIDDDEDDENVGGMGDESD